jgi:hypothetical protein
MRATYAALVREAATGDRDAMERIDSVCSSVAILRMPRT